MRGEFTPVDTVEVVEAGSSRLQVGGSSLFFSFLNRQLLLAKAYKFPAHRRYSEEFFTVTLKAFAIPIGNCIILFNKFFNRLEIKSSWSKPQRFLRLLVG